MSIKMSFDTIRLKSNISKAIWPKPSGVFRRKRPPPREYEIKYGEMRLVMDKIDGYSIEVLGRLVYGAAVKVDKLVGSFMACRGLKLIDEDYHTAISAVIDV